jgi:hypothetical protein
MGKIDLLVRDLTTEEEEVVVFEDVAAARAWLVARPRFKEGVGIVTADIDHETSHALRDAMRPLDAEEVAASKRIDDTRDAASAKAHEAANAQRATEAEARREAMKTADPNRTMEVKWKYDGEMRLTDRDDPRAITDAAREAVMEWIRERDGWVVNRGQIVGEATVTVWPGEVPIGGERIVGGRFFPVTGPKG